MTEYTPMFRRFDLEMNWGRRLMRDWGIDIFAGSTDADMRRERIRRCIIDNNAPETVREAFEKFYNQPVEHHDDEAPQSLETSE